MLNMSLMDIIQYCCALDWFCENYSALQQVAPPNDFSILYPILRHIFVILMIIDTG